MQKRLRTAGLHLCSVQKNENHHIEKLELSEKVSLLNIHNKAKILVKPSNIYNCKTYYAND
jgi:hypothetical protein